MSLVLIGWLKFLTAFGLTMYVTVKLADWFVAWRERFWHRKEEK